MQDSCNKDHIAEEGRPTNMPMSAPQQMPNHQVIQVTQPQYQPGVQYVIQQGVPTGPQSYVIHVQHPNAMINYAPQMPGQQPHTIVYQAGNPMISTQVVVQGSKHIDLEKHVNYTHQVQNVVHAHEVVPHVKKTGYQKLEELSGIYIKKKLELLEVLTGCETENKYSVFPLKKKEKGAHNGGHKEGKKKKKGKEIFKCKEKSNAVARFCLSGDCRPFKMKVANLNRVGDEEEHETFLSLERPCKCTFLCFARPELIVTLTENGRTEYLGKIVDPFNWCNMQFNVFDKDNVKKFVIEGSCLQLGVWCRCPMDPCQLIKFDIKTPSGEVIAHMEKRSAGCFKAMVSDADKFILNFPPNTTPADKALLMSAVLFIDYRHFEENPMNGGSHLGGDL